MKLLMVQVYFKLPAVKVTVTVLNYVEVFCWSLAVFGSSKKTSGLSTTISAMLREAERSV